MVIWRHHFFLNTGIRSLYFKEDMLTIGTGAGTIYFFDLRAGRYLEHDCGHPISIQLGKGWLVSMLASSAQIMTL